MDIALDTLTASEARENLYRLIDQVGDEHMPVIIKGKRTEAVLVSREDWNSIQETLYLTSIPGMVASIKEGGALPLEDCIEGSPFDK